MTEQNLDRLFESARTAATQTSVDEVTRWVGAAALGGASLGLGAKLKLFLTKKMILMMSGTLCIIGTALVVSSGIFVTDTPADPEVTSPDSQKEIQIGRQLPQRLPLQVRVDLPGNGQTALNQLAPVSYPSQGIAQLLITTPDPDSPEIRPAFALVTDVIRPVRTTEDTTKAQTDMRELTVQPFQKLELNGVYDVVIRQGSEYKVLVESDEQDLVIANQEGDWLTLSNSCEVSGESCCEGKGRRDKKRECKSIEDEDGVTLYITVKDLSELYMSGIGNVTVSSLKMENLDVSFTGVGNVDLNLECTDFALQSSGIGTVRLAGRSESAIIDYSGVGDIEAYEFIVQDLELNGSGIGNVFLHAGQAIDVESTGVGDVRFKGNPARRNLVISGIGSIEPKDQNQLSMEGLPAPEPPKPPQFKSRIGERKKFKKYRGNRR